MRLRCRRVPRTHARSSGRTPAREPRPLRRSRRRVDPQPRARVHSATSPAYLAHCACDCQAGIGLYAQTVGEVQAARETAAVPFLDLSRSNAPLKDAILADIADLIDSNAFTNGPQVAEFEEAWAEYCGTRYCVGLASGLDALRLALIGLDIGAGDEVIVPANTFIASVEAVTQAGATPVLVDASDIDWNMDVEAAEAAITPRTRAI